MQSRSGKALSRENRPKEAGRYDGLAGWGTLDTLPVERESSTHRVYRVHPRETI